MSANVETMFYVREPPWHGLGTKVMEAPASAEALTLAGVDWNVIQKEIETEDGIRISGFKANIRDRDKKVLGIVTDRYKVVQNIDAFSFTDKLLGEGVTYETAGSLQDGRRTFNILGRMHIGLSTLYQILLHILNRSGKDQILRRIYLRAQ